MNVPFRIARRYLWARKSTAIHLVSGISVVVVAAVCAAMITILSAFNGIEELVEELFSSLDTELAVLPAEGRVMEGEWVDSLAAHPEVAADQVVLEQDVVVRAGANRSLCPCWDSMWTTPIKPVWPLGSAEECTSGVRWALLADMWGWAWPVNCAFPSVPMPRHPDSQRAQAGTPTGPHTRI